MPSPLPTPYTKDAFPHSDALSPWVDERLQAVSFFVVSVLVCAWLLRALWSLLRRDWPTLPALSYCGALAGTVLWGLVFVVVLTMISGARELMTPGAWRKSGWTYRLEEDARRSSEPHFRNERRQRLEALRLALLKFAVTHSGDYPAQPSDLEESWAIPAHPGFEFLYRPGMRADDNAARVLVFEPEVGGEERFVLLTSGLIGSMRTPELEAALAAPPILTGEIAP
ncbi:MAG TPA: hypothetical protein VM165_09225 [Planctomycetaceae bacterium]|nr:hypothetical protein [Planctomycetaceae bacterium]